MKVILVHPHIFAGGAEKAIVYLAYHMGKLGHEAVVCTLSTELNDLPPVATQIPYIVAEKPSPPPQFESITGAFRSVVRETRTMKSLVQHHLDDYDLLIPCNFPAYWSTYAYRDSKPILWISSEAFGPYNSSRDSYDTNRLFRFAVDSTAHVDRYIVKKSIDEVITCSDLNRQLIKERYSLDAAVVPTAVDYDFFSEDCSDAKEELGLKDRYVLLHVGALVKRKNQILSIRALQRLKRAIPNAKLIIVGEGPWEPTLRNEVQELGLEGEVLFAGRVSESRLKLLYHACDVNLYPVEDQTYGLVPFEAFAAGKPSLVSEQSGAGQVMAREGLGYLIQPEVNSIVDRALNIYGDGQEAETIVKKGSTYVKDKLTWNLYASRVAELCENVNNS